MQNLIFLLKESCLFAGIKEEELKVMLKCLNGFVKNYKKGEFIILEKENVEHIGLVLSGTVDMRKEDIWGNTTLLVRMKNLQLFGESFACGINNSSEVSFCASSDASVLFLPFYRVLHNCSKSCMFHHRLIENMVVLIAEKNRDLMEKVEIISKKSLREKILAYLSLQSQRKESRYFEIPLDRAELADYLCADRSALSRELSNMKKEGLLDFTRNTFRLLE